MQATKKVWLKTTYWATREDLELAQFAFIKSGAIGIEIIDDEIEKKAHPGALLKAFFDFDEELTRVLRKNFASLGLKGKISFSPIEEEGWQSNFAGSCSTSLIDPGVYVVPTRKVQEFKRRNLDQLFIELDSENTFGTGQHETTRLCIKKICNSFKDRPKKASCLDVGTGSGILAILVKKLGAKSVLATDICDEAIVTASKNAKKNGVKINFCMVKPSYEYGPKTFDMVVANVLAPVLIGLRRNLYCSLRDGGELILSGFLVEQLQSIKNAYLALGLSLIEVDRMGSWSSLRLLKEKERKPIS